MRGVTRASPCTGEVFHYIALKKKVEVKIIRPLDMTLSEVFLGIA
jgi:hypothetical protein